MNRWLLDYSKSAKLSDKFSGRPDHKQLIAAGLFGEVGSVLAEVKKRQREDEVYPRYLGALAEELGDCLWYFVRLAELCDKTLLRQLSRVQTRVSRRPALASALELGAATGRIISALEVHDLPAMKSLLSVIWRSLERIASSERITLREAAEGNLQKTQSRWPVESARAGWPRSSDYYPLFDAKEAREEQFPGDLDIEFIERGGERKQVVLRCNGINVGARINDNISDPDFYRFHDIFHLSYMVFLGWSPVIRSLLRCKRKSDPNKDENEDGARAGIIEEAISAIVFARAKNVHYFEGAPQVDYDLLKNIAEFVRGYEVAAVPMWQWERAILEGFRVFRLLKANRGGRVSIRLKDRTVTYRAQRGRVRAARKR